MASHDANIRSLVARAAIHARLSQIDRVEMTAQARAEFLSRFEREVDPDGVLDPAERSRRAEHARKSYFAKLALKSAQARRARRMTNGSQDVDADQAGDAADAT